MLDGSEIGANGIQSRLKGGFCQSEDSHGDASDVIRYCQRSEFVYLKHNAGILTRNHNINSSESIALLVCTSVYFLLLQECLGVIRANCLPAWRSAR